MIASNSDLVRGGGRGWGSRFSSNLPSSLTPSAEFACANSGMQACNPSQQRGGRGEGGRYKKNNGECYSVGMSFKGTVSKEKYGVFIMEGIALGVTFLQSSVKRATIF